MMFSLWKKKKKIVEKPAGKPGEIKTTKKITERKRTVSFKTGGTLKLTPCSYQHVGARENQEDAFMHSAQNEYKKALASGFIAAVADGMGGLALGEEASNVAIKTFIQEYLKRPDQENISDNLVKAVEVANTAVFDCAFDGKSYCDLGTTLIATVVHKDRLYWVSAGDSRIYLFRDNKLKQLTRDHVYARHLQLDVESGIITQSEADNHPERSHLISYLGLPELPEIDQSSEPVVLENGDIILLSTDGLFDTLNSSEIEKVLENGLPDPAVELVKTALLKNNKFQDNITVITLSMTKS